MVGVRIDCGREVLETTQDRSSSISGRPAPIETERASNVRAIQRDDESPRQGPNMEKCRRHSTRQARRRKNLYDRQRRPRRIQGFVPLLVGAERRPRPHCLPLRVRRNPERALLLCIGVVHGRPQRNRLGRWQEDEHCVLRIKSSLRARWSTWRSTLTSWVLTWWTGRTTPKTMTG